jgi:hypothetical protein
VEDKPKNAMYHIPIVAVAAAAAMVERQYSVLAAGTSPVQGI